MDYCSQTVLVQRWLQLVYPAMLVKATQVTWASHDKDESTSASSLQTRSFRGSEPHLEQIGHNGEIELGIICLHMALCSKTPSDYPQWLHIALGRALHWINWVEEHSPSSTLWT